MITNTKHILCSLTSRCYRTAITSPCRFSSFRVSNHSQNAIDEFEIASTDILQQRRQVTTLSLTSQKRRGKKITMVTAYDFPSAMHVQRANIDMILVGDSAAMVELGYDTTQPITLDQMLHHCQAVKRGVEASINGIKSKMEKAKKPLLVGDMPFGSYEYKDLDIALKNAYRFVKEGGMDAVKLEGGSEHRAKTIRHIVEGGGKNIAQGIFISTMIDYL